MAIINPRNTGTLVGRLAQDPIFFANQDGSRTVKFTLMTRHNYKNSGEPNYGSDAVSVERFIPAGNSNGVFAAINKGDQVMLTVHMRTDRWTGANGQTNYVTKIIVDDVTLLDSLKTKQERQANHAVQMTQYSTPLDDPIVPTATAFEEDPIVPTTDSLDDPIVPTTDSPEEDPIVPEKPRFVVWPPTVPFPHKMYAEYRKMHANRH